MKASGVVSFTTAGVTSSSPMKETSAVASWAWLSGRSSIRKVAIETGQVVQRRDVDAEYFGEGITIWKSDLIELTWQSKVGFVYDRSTFAPKRTFSYPGEGWGLTPLFKREN